MHSSAVGVVSASITETIRPSAQVSIAAGTAQPPGPTLPVSGDVAVDEYSKDLKHGEIVNVQACCIAPAAFGGAQWPYGGLVFSGGGGIERAVFAVHSCSDVAEAAGVPALVTRRQNRSLVQPAFVHCGADTITTVLWPIAIYQG